MSSGQSWLPTPGQVSTFENLQKHGPLDKAQCLESDVFDSIEEQKFDLIFWNFPFHPTTKSLADMDWLE